MSIGVCQKHTHVQLQQEDIGPRDILLCIKGHSHVETYPEIILYGILKNALAFVNHIVDCYIDGNSEWH